MVSILRVGLLEGRAVALAGAPSAELADALRALGARLEQVPALDAAAEERVGEWARSCMPLHALVVCAAAGALETGLADVWLAVREVAVGALIGEESGGKIVLVAPRLDAAAQAALENLARTLSVEWARFGVTVVAVAPGAHVREDELAQVVCYLVSPAGDYFSGCRLDVGLVARGSR